MLLNKIKSSFELGRESALFEVKITHLKFVKIKYKTILLYIYVLFIVLIELLKLFEKYSLDILFVSRFIYK